MKTKYLFLSITLLVFASVVISGQPKQTLKTKTIKVENDISNVLGKPVFESTKDSLNTKVWILSQKKYKAMQNTKVGKTMSKMDNKMTMDKGTEAAVLTGTHYFIFDVTNITSGKQFADTSAKVSIVSATKKISSVNLQPMMNHFGGGVMLNERGYYLFTINLNVGAGYRTSQFKYKVR